MTITKFPVPPSRRKAQNAVQARNEQFADIDAKIDRIVALRREMAERCKGLGTNDWRYTGRGGDLARIQADLARVLERWPT